MPDFIVVLNSYLENLKDQQSILPEDERKEVPTLADLAVVANIKPPSLSRIASNKIARLNRKVVANIIAELRRRGFNTTETDIVKYVE